MATNEVWLITGAGRGLGVDIAKAALAGGHKVVPPPPSSLTAPFSSRDLLLQEFLSHYGSAHGSQNRGDLHYSVGFPSNPKSPFAYNRPDVYLMDDWR